MSEQHPVERLFALLDQVSPYPAGVIPLWARIGGTAFFPGGSGLWGAVAHQPLPPMPIGGVMVLGHNFDCETGFAYSLAHAGENLNGPTWRTLRGVLERAGIAMEACFFTNAYIGLKAGSKPTGKFPGVRDAAFVRRCQQFLLEQVRIQQPRLLLTLGKEVPRCSRRSPQRCTRRGRMCAHSARWTGVGLGSSAPSASPLHHTPPRSSL